MAFIEIKIVPMGNEDNEYSTPCHFKFKDMDEAYPFIKTVAEKGQGIDMYMREVED